MTTIVNLARTGKQSKFARVYEDYHKNESFINTLAFRQKQLKKEDKGESKSSERGNLPAFLQDPGFFDEEKVVRDAMGKFASKAGGAKSLTEDQKKRLKELNELREKLSESDDVPPAQKAAYEAALAQLEAMMGLSFDSPEQAMATLASEMKSLGIDVPEGFSVRVADLGKGIAGEYDPNTNQFTLAPAIADGLKNGNPTALGVISHEMLHGVQETSRLPGDGETLVTFGDQVMQGTVMPVGWLDDSESKRNYQLFTEGQNELVNQAVLSRIYGVPITPLGQEVTNWLYNDRDTPWAPSYAQAADMWALGAVGQGGENPYDWLVGAHGNGFDAVAQVNTLSSFIPASLDSVPEPRGTYVDLFESVTGQDFTLQTRDIAMEDVYSQVMNNAINFRPGRGESVQ